MISCPSCGTLNVDGTSQCMRCGAVFPSTPVAAPPADVARGLPSPAGDPATPPAGASPGVGSAAGGPGYGAPPAGYGAPGYGAPPSGYGPPPAGGFGAPPAGGGGFGAPPSGPGYGTPPGHGGAPGDYRIAPVGIPQAGAGAGAVRPAAAPALDVGDVLGTAFELWKSNFAPLATLWAVCIAPGWFVATLGAAWQAYSVSAMQTGGAPDLGGPIASAGLTLLGSLIQFAGLAIAAGPTAKIGFDAYSRRPVDALQASLAYGLENGFTMFGISFLTSLAFSIGLVLCCVPGVLVWCIAALAIPAAIAESRGVTDALQRSSDLTDGTRTEVFLVGLALFATYLAVSIPAMCVAGGVAAGAAVAGGPAAAGATLAQQFFVLLTTIVMYSFMSLVAVVMYIRRSGYGTRTDGASVASVFG